MSVILSTATTYKRGGVVADRPVNSVVARYTLDPVAAGLNFDLTLRREHVGASRINDEGALIKYKWGGCDTGRVRAEAAAQLVVLDSTRTALGPLAEYAEFRAYAPGVCSETINKS